MGARTGASTHEGAPNAAALTAASTVATWQGPVTVHRAEPVPRSRFAEELDVEPTAGSGGAGTFPSLIYRCTIPCWAPQITCIGSQCVGRVAQLLYVCHLWLQPMRGLRRFGHINTWFAFGGRAAEAQAEQAAAALHAAARQLDAGSVRNWTDYLKVTHALPTWKHLFAGWPVRNCAQLIAHALPTCGVAVAIAC